MGKGKTFKTLKKCCESDHLKYHSWLCTSTSFHFGQMLCQHSKHSPENHCDNILTHKNSTTFEYQKFGEET